MKHFLIPALILLWTLPSGADNWPSFRGPNGSGVAEAEKTPVRWNVKESANIAWQTPIPGLSRSSPILWEPVGAASASDFD